ncbi:unnamed protein product [Phyllotreta striolata]|uniref:Uncharacterized protein n=1 Tax=Phyllotreta striolata TaxID=444603 RepID=A0A9N9TW34_PHYSR|nr:unnamed protein product [Phyllotreta striolata]
MELSEKSQSRKTDGPLIDFDEYDMPEDTKKYLQSLNIADSISFPTSSSAENLKNVPSTSKISMISDTQTTQNFLKEFEAFYSDMMGKVKGLKSVPALKKPHYKDADSMDGTKLMKNLKNSPEIQEQLDAIKQLDDDIQSVITEYQSEKSDRLDTQLEMCNEIAHGNKQPDRDAELFLNLCQFEFSDNKKDDNKEDQPVESPDKTKKKPKTAAKQQDFVLRNIYLAKRGGYTHSSLTDEEKVKLEDILQYDEENNQKRQQKSPFTLTNSHNEPSKYFSNAYLFSEEDRKKIDDIDTELEKFKLDEAASEKNQSARSEDSTESVEAFRKLNKKMLKNKLKMLEVRLKELKEAEDRDLKKLNKIQSPSAVDVDDENIEDFPPICSLFDDEENKEDAEQSTEEVNDSDDDEEVDDEELDDDDCKPANKFDGTCDDKSDDCKPDDKFDGTCDDKSDEESFGLEDEEYHFEMVDDDDDFDDDEVYSSNNLT